MRYLLLAAVLAASSLASAVAAQPALDPILAGHEWLNGMPSAGSLRGKVVLVDVFTFNCSNCKNVTPNLRALYRRRGNDLVILGIHSPETKDESLRSNVREQLAVQGIEWPVAIDNDFALWNALGVEYWPTQFIFDRRGRLRSTVVGDSQDQKVDATVQQLIDER